VRLLSDIFREKSCNFLSNMNCRSSNSLNATLAACVYLPLTNRSPHASWISPTSTINKITEELPFLEVEDCKLTTLPLPRRTTITWVLCTDQTHVFYPLSTVPLALGDMVPVVIDKEKVLWTDLQVSWYLLGFLSIEKVGYVYCLVPIEALRTQTKPRSYSLGSCRHLHLCA
jgi:hypothetical protein